MPKRLPTGVNRSGRLILASIFLLATLWGLYDLMTPATELTRFRNSLIATPGPLVDFEWAPQQAPTSFGQETLPVPAPLQEWADGIDLESDTVTLTRAIVEHLRQRPKQKGPIKSSTLIAYEQITQFGRGYCADYTQVFSALAHAVGVPVREWGMSFDRYGGDGHAFSEVWIAANQQWMFVDPLNGFYVEDKATGRPLSVLEFRDRLIEERGEAGMSIVPIGSTFRFDSPGEAIRYYRHGADQFFLWFANDVLSYDRHPLVQTLGPVSRAMEQLAAILWGIHPRIHILQTPTNTQQIRDLLRLRYLVLGLVLTAALLAVFILAQLMSSWRSRRSALTSRPQL